MIPHRCSVLAFLAFFFALALLGGCVSVARLQARCFAGQGAACLAAAERLQAEPHTAIDAPRTAALLERACRRSEPVGCALLAERYFYGMGVALDWARGEMLALAACEKGAALGCVLAAYGREEGLSQAADRKRAAELYLRGATLAKPECERSVDACAILGEALLRLSRNVAEAAPAHGILARACDAGSGRACLTAAYALDLGRGLPAREPSAAARAYERACKAGYMRACNNLGTDFVHGDGVEKNQRRALELLRLACDGHVGKSCYALALLTARGQAGPKDLRAARALVAKGCARGEAAACAHEALDVLRAEDAAGRAKEPTPAAKGALERMRDACERRSGSACFNIGVLHADGRFLANDPGLARDHLHRACVFGESRGCQNLGQMIMAGDLGPKDPPRAMVYFERGCALGTAISCDSLGVVLVTQGKGTEAERARGARLFQKSCGMGFARGCFHLAVAKWMGDGTPKDPEGAVAMQARACKGRFMEACMRLAIFLEKGLPGTGVKKDETAARVYYARACRSKIQESCARLGVMLHEGRGGPKNARAGIALVRAACHGGFEAACKALGLPSPQKK